MKSSRSGAATATRRSFLVAAGGAIGACALGAEYADADLNGSPVVVELFTSQGCNSCPPAEAHMRDYSRRSNIVALEFHVDYWDYIGWKDPFASAAYTQRQRVYARRFNRSSVYTPQVVMDGRTEMVGTHQDKINDKVQEFTRSGRGGMPSIEIGADGDYIAVSVSGGASGSEGDVMVASVDKETSTRVRRGENGGRTLVNTNMVRSFGKAGDWRGEDIVVRVRRSELVGNRGLAVLVQEPGQGPVLRARQVDWDELS